MAMTIATALLTAVAVAVVGPAPASTARPRVPTITWQNRCYFTGAQCATVHVPLDYDRPGGATVALALARIPARQPQRKIGTLFVNPGGPGNSGVDWLLLAAPDLLDPQILARFDIVSFDPRGVHRSEPVQCVTTDDPAADPYDDLPLFPLTAAEQRATYTADAAYAKLCARRNAKLLPHMSTANVARDLDLMRQAVGDAKLTYAGFSYGTFLGATYAAMFPGKVRAMWLDGVLDPVAWSTGRGMESLFLPYSTRVRSGDGSRAAMSAFLRACDRAGSACAFSAGDPVRRWATLLQRVKRNPILDEDGEVMISYQTLVNSTLSLLYFQDEWPGLGFQLQDTWELSDPATSPAARRRLVTKVAARLATEPPPNVFNDVDGFYGVACADTRNPRSPRIWPLAARWADHTGSPFGSLWTWDSSRCGAWSVRDTDRYPGRYDKRTAPLLIVGNRYDPATPYSGAVALSRLHPNSRLLTLDYAGHVSLGQSRCVTAAATRYLVDRTLPRRGTVCAADRPPFSQVGPEQRARLEVLKRTVGR